MSRSTLGRRNSELAWPVFPIAASAISYPFDYSDEDRTDLATLRALLKDLNVGVNAWIRYQSRDDFPAMVAENREPKSVLLL